MISMALPQLSVSHIDQISEQTGQLPIYVQNGNYIPLLTGQPRDVVERCVVLIAASSLCKKYKLNQVCILLLINRSHGGVPAAACGVVRYFNRKFCSR